MPYRPLHDRRRPTARRAFTLIELLIVLAIIVILIGMVFAGMKQWGRTASRNSTATRLELLNGMLSELDAAGHQSFVSQPFMTGAAITATTYGNVGSDSGTRKTAIHDTSVNIMSKLARLPNNQKGLQGLPSNALGPDTTAGTGSSPVVLDGWNNPILFVPAGGLSGVILNYGTSAQKTVTITSPDGRPFWASAGGDGDFTKGDDNVYSFEQH